MGLVYGFFLGFGVGVCGGDLVLYWSDRVFGVFCLDLVFSWFLGVFFI